MCVPFRMMRRETIPSVFPGFLDIDQLRRS
jgi:hypothetical protein